MTKCISHMQNKLITNTQSIRNHCGRKSSDIFQTISRRKMNFLKPIIRPSLRSRHTAAIGNAFSVEIQFSLNDLSILISIPFFETIILGIACIFCNNADIDIITDIIDFPIKRDGKLKVLHRLDHDTLTAFPIGKHLFTRGGIRCNYV